MTDDATRTSPLLDSLKGDVVALLAGLVGLALSVVVIRVVGSPGSLPIAVLLIPVLGVSLVARPLTTGLVGVVALVVALVSLTEERVPTNDERLRLGALVIGSAIAVATAWIRARRDRSLTEREVALALTQQQAESQEIVASMLERLPALTEAADIPTVAANACRIARELFLSDSASYWQVEGEDAVLLARDPVGTLTIGTRLPVESFTAPPTAVEGGRTRWMRRQDLTRQPAAVPAVQRTGTAVGTSTPVRVGGSPAAYLGLGWEDERSLPATPWLGALDRYADQVAIAKTVVRRRLAQNEAQNLGRRLQAGLLPVRLPDEGRVLVRSEYRPGTRHLLLGGDFLDVVRDPADDSVAFLLGDVSGHGPEQAALGTMMRSAWVGVASLPSTSLKEWVQVLDYVVRERRPSEDLFVTAVMGRIDIRQGLLHYVLAGHPPPILLTPELVSLPTGDPPLGVLPEAVVTLHTIELPLDWSLLLITDGLYEGRASADERERVGYDGFLDIIRERGGDPLHDTVFLRSLADDMEQRNGGPLPDDAAAVLLAARP